MEQFEKYEVKLFGQNFILTTNDGSKNDLKIVVDYYKKVVEKLTEKLPNRPQLDIAILAGLKIADKLYSLANNKNIKLTEEDEENELQKKIIDAIKRLDNSLTL